MLLNRSQERCLIIVDKEIGDDAMMHFVAVGLTISAYFSALPALPPGLRAGSGFHRNAGRTEVHEHRLTLYKEVCAWN